MASVSVAPSWQAERVAFVAGRDLQVRGGDRRRVGEEGQAASGRRAARQSDPVDPGHEGTGMRVHAYAWV